MRRSPWHSEPSDKQGSEKQRQLVVSPILQSYAKGIPHVSTHLNIEAMLTDSQALQAAGSVRHQPRPLWVWCVFAVLVLAGLTGGYLLIFENPALARIQYVANYPHDVSLSGSASGFFRWQYDSIVAHTPASAPLSVLVDDRRLMATELTPQNLAKLGATATHEPRSTLWRLQRGAQSLWCDFRDGQIVQIWLRHDMDNLATGAEGGKIGVCWGDGAPAYLPLDAGDLDEHFGPPEQVLKDRALRFLAGL